jgi:hypothetical protein
LFLGFDLELGGGTARSDGGAGAGDEDGGGGTLDTTRFRELAFGPKTPW